MMNCPYCSNEMEKGYIDQTHLMHPLEWYPANRGDGFIANKKRNIKLTALLKGGTLITYHCAKCKKFIIDETMIET